jgi:copper chaperone CopZ
MTTAAITNECPCCKTECKVVKPVTLRSLLKDEFIPQVADVPYRFCDSKGCEVVYFREGQTFTKAQLKVPVGVKEKSGERPLCYCFGHSIATIKDELRTKGRSDAVGDIRNKINEQGCWCEVTNPSGSCCLGSIFKGVEVAKAEFRQESTSGNYAEVVTKIGAVLAAVVASSCCWLPLVLLAFGLSGAGFAGVLDTYRPVFIALTVTFLGTAFYLTNRPRGAARPAAGDCCSPAKGCCDGPGSAMPRHVNRVAANKLMLWVVTVFAVAFLCFPKYVGPLLAWWGSAGSGTSATTAAVKKTVFAVRGMHCEGCALTVERTLQSVPGVLGAKVDYARGRAEVATEACCAVPTGAILQALERAGYHGELTEVGAPVEQTGGKHSPEAEARRNDPERQIVFAVPGFS